MRRDFVMEGRSSRWLLLKRPLEFLFFCGCVVSLWTSGRLSARLIADGMVSFAFLPVFQIASFAVVFGRAPRRVGFAPAADRFFAGNTPWLLWLAAFGALRCVLTAEQAGAPPLLLWRAVQVSLVGVAAWSLRVDLQYFRELSPSEEDIRDLILQRAISWGGSGVYFLGIAIWPVVAGRFV